MATDPTMEYEVENPDESHHHHHHGGGGGATSFRFSIGWPSLSFGMLRSMNRHIPYTYLHTC